MSKTNEFISRGDKNFIYKKKRFDSQKYFGVNLNRITTAMLEILSKI